MTDPMFDMNFLGSSGSPTVSHSGLLDPTLDNFSMLSGVDTFSQRSSLFEHLSDNPTVENVTDTSSTYAVQHQPTSSTTFDLSQSQTINSLDSHYTSATDYSKHFSEDFSSLHSASTQPVDTDNGISSSKNAITSESQSNVVPTDGDAVSIATSSDNAQTLSQSVPAPVIDVVINNVVCSFSTRCHINLKKLAREGLHVVYKPENGMVSMKLRKPYTTANIWSSGKITITGATSDESAKVAARRISRRIQKLGFKVRLSNYRIVNVLGTCSLPFGIRITHFSRDHPKDCSYEPELHPGATYKVKSLKATLKIFSTGSITVTAPKVENIQLAIQHIFPLVFPYRMDDSDITESEASVATAMVMPGNNKRVSRFDPKRKKQRKKFRYYVEDSDGEVWSDSTDVELDSDEELECDDDDF